MFSLFKKKSERSSKSTFNEQDKVEIIGEKEKLNEEEFTLEEKKKLEHREELKSMLAEKRSREEQKEKEKRQKLLQQESIRLKNINYAELILAPINILNNEKDGFIKTDLKISYDNINFLLLESDGIKIKSKSSGKFTIVKGEHIINNQNPIGIFENGELLYSFLISEAQVKQIEDFISKINVCFLKEQIIFRNEVNKHVNEMKNNNDIYTICYNFIGKNNLAFYYDPDYIVYIENIFKSISNIGEKTLINLNPKNFNTNINDEVGNFMEDKLLPLMQIVTPRYPKLPLNINGLIDTKKRYYIFWSLLRNIAQDFFSNLLIKNNPRLEYLVDEISLEECIAVYAKNEIIDPMAMNNIASLTYFLLKNNKIDNEDWNIIDSIEYITNKLKSIEYNNKLQRLEKELLNPSKGKITLNDIDLISGLEFEEFIANLFTAMGFRVETTKASGDQGVDVIAEKSGKKIGIQAKCYSSEVNNKAIQEVAAGINHYKLDKGLVVTNNFFTESARELAASNDIILWDRKILKEKIEEFF